MADSRTPFSKGLHDARVYVVHLSSGDRSLPEEDRQIRNLDELIELAYEFDTHLMLGFWAPGERGEDDPVDFFVTIHPEEDEGLRPGKAHEVTAADGSVVRVTVEFGRR